MFEFTPRRKNIPDQELLDDVKEVAVSLSRRSVTIDQYSDHGKFHATALTRRFGSWHEVLNKCELEQNRTPMNIPKEELFENLAEVWTNLGKQPRYNDLSKMKSKFCAGTYERRFGSWNNALKSFIEYLKGNEIGLPEKIADEKKPVRKTNRKINWRLRAKILIRDSCICQMCGARPAKDPEITLHVDHIKPYSKGGETIEENLRTLCNRCNIGKSDMVINAEN